MSKQALEVCRLFVEVIHSVEGRCMAADGPVTKTCDEITDEELRRVYVAATAALSHPEAPKAAGEPVADGRLHADGYFTWNKGKRPAYIADRGLPCDFYLHPPTTTPAQASDAWLLELLRRARPYVDSASKAYYDGTDGHSTRQSAAALLGKMNEALSDAARKGEQP